MTILEPCLLDRLVRGILSDMRRRGDGRYLPDSRPRTRRRPYGLYLWPLDVYEAWSRLDKASDKVFSSWLSWWESTSTPGAGLLAGGSPRVRPYKGISAAVCLGYTLTGRGMAYHQITSRYQRSQKAPPAKARTAAVIHGHQCRVWPGAATTSSRSLVLRLLFGSGKAFCMLESNISKCSMDCL